MDRSIGCECGPGLVGDGKVYCNGDVMSTLATLSQAASFYQVQCCIIILETKYDLRGECKRVQSTGTSLFNSIKNFHHTKCLTFCIKDSCYM